MAESSTCAVCLTEPAFMALVPCGHKCVCTGCCTRLRSESAKCPICRARIHAAIHVHDAGVPNDSPPPPPPPHAPLVRAESITIAPDLAACEAGADRRVRCNVDLRRIYAPCCRAPQPARGRLRASRCRYCCCDRRERIDGRGRNLRGHSWSRAHRRPLCTRHCAPRHSCRRCAPQGTVSTCTPGVVCSRTENY